MSPAEFPASFEQLVSSICDVHGALSAQASKAVNISLTLRNWLIGAYIAEYELNGADRAVYCDNLLSNLAERLLTLNISNSNQLFVSRYQLELSDPEEMKCFIEREIAERGVDEDGSAAGMLVKEMRAKYRTRTGR